MGGNLALQITPEFRAYSGTGGHSQSDGGNQGDAYGHGAVPVAKCLAACGADWFGVATVEEALELRTAGVRQPVLLLGGLYMSDPAHLIEYGLTPSISPPCG